MKIYKDVTNDLILSVTDEGYGYAVSTVLAEMGMMFGAHKQVVKASVQEFLNGDKGIHLLTNEAPLVGVVENDDHPYIGLTLDEVIAKFCPEAPEEI